MFFKKKSCPSLLCGFWYSYWKLLNINTRWISQRFFTITFLFLWLLKFSDCLLTDLSAASAPLTPHLHSGGHILFWLVHYIPLFASFFFFKLKNFFLVQQLLSCSLSGIFLFGIHWPFLPLGLVLGPPLHPSAWAVPSDPRLHDANAPPTRRHLHQHSMFLIFFSTEPSVYLTFLLVVLRTPQIRISQNLLIISPLKALPLVPAHPAIHV